MFLDIQLDWWHDAWRGTSKKLFVHVIFQKYDGSCTHGITVTGVPLSSEVSDPICRFHFRPMA